MVISIDTLEEDIYKLLEGKTLIESISKFQDEIGKMMVKRFASVAEERAPTLRMSNLGRPLRQLWYELKGYPSEPINGKALLKFFYGDLIETTILFLAEASGHSVERLQEEVEINGIKGHIDAVIDGYIVDVKSCSPYSFNKFKTKSLFDDDPFGYVGQLSGYSSALKLPARFIAVNKVLGDICQLELPQDRIDAYNVRSRIGTVQEALSRDFPPDKCYPPEADGKSGNLKLSVGCSYCNYKSECWKDANNGQGLRTYFYSTGPRYLVKVVKEPRVNEENKDYANYFQVKETN